ncbi:MAG TPA: ribonuclease P protein component [Candidatus Rifleibacterium sp.]|nr:ribonuclease P protein component [Candidatus Rifleibacterium sp.]HPT47897.1 ribonuclease P protein component [Candidatus Rifleibacterium sp.]
MNGQNATRRLTLRAHSEFQRVFAARTRFFRNGLGFCYRKISGDEFRFGISIPKRFGKAVERNKTRRRLKEIIRRSEALPAEAQVVLCISRPCADLDFDCLKTTCEWAFGKISRVGSKSEAEQQ